ncbi:MAG TPA: DUF736 domain-containing protein [Azospirillum sp.]|nr:DUF736 domain-containing protein [Azospirillum sp.]
MATIGTFTKDGDGYTGQIRTLTLNAKAKLTPEDKASDKAPDYRVFVGTIEIGAGWKRTGRDGGADYVSLKLDDPSFPAPVYANLVHGEDGGFVLLWSR